MYLVAKNKDGYYDFVVGVEDVTDENGNVTGTKDVIYRIPTTRTIYCGCDKYGNGSALMGVDTTGWDIVWHLVDSNVDPETLINAKNFAALNKAMFSTRCPELAACCITIAHGDDLAECLAIDYTGDKLDIKDAKTSGAYVGLEDDGMP